jgi:PQQ-dependent catabolism-associated CXXCW motif protein
MIATLWLLLALPTDPGSFDPVTGYRIAHYRGVVPAAPEGVRRIDDAEVLSLQRHRAALFLDVTPADGGHRDADSGAWHLAEQHETIPGAHWFPEAGRGVVDPAIAAWFDAGVARLAHGEHRRPIVIFCRADCWMSWNAAIRLHRAGYRDVRWYANGADGWRDLGRPLSALTPER